MAREKNTGSCPTHGTEFMIQEGHSFYCTAPTPRGKCFYHPKANHPKDSAYIIKKRKQEERECKPNLFKVMVEEWERHKKNRIRSRNKQRRAAKKKLLASFN